jgi:hypothetical protein
VIQFAKWEAKLCGYVLTAVALTGCVTNKSNETPHRSGLKLEANLDVHDKARILLNLTLLNHTSKELQVNSGELPWDTYGMTLVLVEGEPLNVVLRQSPIIRDPVPAIPQTLRIGGAIRGVINLNEQFNQLSNILQESDVIVFWSYQLKPLTGKRPERVAGWKLIQKVSNDGSDIK